MLLFSGLFNITQLCLHCHLTGFSLAKELGLEVFHAGTAIKDGKVVTSGGRVLTVTAVKKDLLSALEKANKGVGVIQFKGAINRKDIGYRAIAFLKQSRYLSESKADG